MTATVPKIEWDVSVSPHVQEAETTARIMWSVAACLTPAGAWAVYVFGPAALYVVTLSVLAAVGTELVAQRLRGKPATVRDGSAVVTGLLLAYCLPSHSPDMTPLKWYVPVTGAVVAIGIAKHAFGGLGQNIWNPALVGRAFVQVSFPAFVSQAQWPWPMSGVDGVTRATALSKSAQTAYSVRELFLGYCPGSLGEVSALFLLIGAAYLIARRYVDWRLPLGYLLALVLLATLLAWSPGDGMPKWVTDFAGSFGSVRHGRIPVSAFFGDWLAYGGMQVFSGGVVLGAFFMATDMVTSPLTSKGQLAFGIGCGVLTAVIRFYSGYPEGVCYSILLMNTVRPYIDRSTRQRVIGESKVRG